MIQLREGMLILNSYNSIVRKITKVRTDDFQYEYMEDGKLRSCNWGIEGFEKSLSKPHSTYQLIDLDKLILE